MRSAHFAAVLALVVFMSLSVDAVTYSCSMSNCASCQDHGLECTGCADGYLLKADLSGCSGLLLK